MFRWLINLSIILILVLLQTSIFSVLPFFKNINLVLLFIVYLTIRGDKSFMWMAIIAGYFLDIYSSYTFGIHILAMMIIALLNNYIYFNILTNHRFFPIVILISLSAIMYHFIISTTIFVLGFLKLLPKTEIANKLIVKNIGVELVYTIIAISIVYLLFFIARKNLRNVFLPASK